MLLLALQSLETAILTRKILVATVGKPLVDVGHMTTAFLSHTCKGAQNHVKRHVRESSFRLITAIIEACGEVHGTDSQAMGIIAQFVPVLVTGLQVRNK